MAFGLVSNLVREPGGQGSEACLIENGIVKR